MRCQTEARGAGITVDSVTEVEVGMRLVDMVGRFSVLLVLEADGLNFGSDSLESVSSVKLLG